MMQVLFSPSCLPLETFSPATWTNTECNHPDLELEEQYGKHIHELELHGTKGIEWSVEVDAVNGPTFKNHQDT
jgi:hypothetical protein